MHMWYMCVCVHTHACIFQGTSGGHRRTCFVSLYLIHLRQGISWNLELGWKLGNPSNPSVSTACELQVLVSHV